MLLGTKIFIYLQQIDKELMTEKQRIQIMYFREQNLKDFYARLLFDGCLQTNQALSSSSQANFQSGTGSYENAQFVLSSQKISTISTIVPSTSNILSKSSQQFDDGNLCILLLDMELLAQSNIQNIFTKILQDIVKTFKNNVIVTIDISKFRGEISNCQEQIKNWKNKSPKIQLKTQNIILINTKSGPTDILKKKIQEILKQVNRVSVNNSLYQLLMKNYLDHTKYVEFILNKQIVKAIQSMEFQKRKSFLLQLQTIQFIKKIYEGYYQRYLHKLEEGYKMAAISAIRSDLNNYQVSEALNLQEILIPSSRNESVQRLKLTRQNKRQFLEALKKNISIQIYLIGFLNAKPQEQVKKQQLPSSLQTIYSRRIQKKKNQLKQILQPLFQQYEIADGQQIFKFIESQRLSQIKKYLKKTGEKFINKLKDIQPVKNFHQYISKVIFDEKEQIQKLLEGKKNDAVLQLIPILTQFQLRNSQRYLNFILKKQFRQLFSVSQLDQKQYLVLQKDIRNLKSLKNYWDTFQDYHFNQSLEKKRASAEQNLKQIMQEFKVDQKNIEQFISEVFDKNYMLASDKTTKDKKQKLLQTLKQNSFLNDYFEQLQKIPNFVEEQIFTQQANTNNLNFQREIFSKTIFSDKRKNQIWKSLTKGDLFEVKQTLQYKQFYALIQQLMKFPQQAQLLSKNLVKTCNSLSYFYYFQNSVDLFDFSLNSILGEKKANMKKTSENNWLEYFHSLDSLKSMQFLYKQLKLFKEASQANQAPHNIFGLTFVELLTQTFKILLIRNYRKYKQYPEDLSIIINFMQEFMNSTIQQWINAIMRKVISQKIKWSALEKQIQQCEISRQNQQEYFKTKLQQLNYYLLREFYLSFKQQISKCNVNVFIDNNLICKIVCLIHVSIKEISQSIENNYKEDDIEINNYYIQLVYEKKHVLISQQDYILDYRPLKIILHQKRDTNIYWDGNLYNVKISNSLNPYFLKEIILSRLAQQNLLSLASSKLVMKGIFGQQNEERIIDQQIRIIEAKIKKQKLHQINLTNLIKVRILEQSDLHQFQMQSGQSITDLKELLYKKSKISIDSQRLKYMNGQNEQQIINQTFYSLPIKRGSILMRLESKVNLAFYGFHANHQLKYQDFSLLTIDDQKIIHELYETCTFRQQEEQQFFQKIISLLFSGLKRKFSFSLVIDKVRKLFSSQLNLWYNPSFNDGFLTFFILYNSQTALRIQLMKLISCPLPLYFRIFSSINNIQNKWKKNQQIAWLLSSSLTFTSIGLHNYLNIQKEQGKTFLNNLLFQTDFLQRNKKHAISLGCPEILLNVFGKTKPVNFIQTSSDTPKQILAQILGSTDYLIIHSWKSRNQTNDFINQVQIKYGIKKIFCFLRDTGSKSISERKLSQIRLQQKAIIIQMCKLPFGESRQNIEFVDLLRTKFWLYFNSSQNQEQIKSKKIQTLFSNKLLEQFNKILQEVKIKFYNLTKVSQKYEKMKNSKQKQFTSTSSKQLEDIKSQVKNEGISEQLKRILIFIHANRTESWLLILHLKHVLEIIKYQYEQQYMIINKSKNEIMMMSQHKDWKKMNEIYQNTRQILKNCPIQIQMNDCKSQGQMYQQFTIATDSFENKVKTKSFTIQMLWRELQYLVIINEEAKIGHFQLHNFLLQLKRDQIHRNQPLQMIDGDLLQMMRNSIRKCFEGITDRVAVISIIGKQSSGKSTLLNFLFGCDFATSEGRCTRGVYGTYYKFSKVKLTNCEGIFVIDTEGLFATLNQKDKSRRTDFDSRLALFCFAISDLVIVNVQRNLDSNTFNILESSWGHLGAVSSDNKKPQVIIVSNQNSSINANSNEGELRKLEELLNCKTVFYLNVAYVNIEMNHEHIPIIPEGTIYFKSKPKQYFLKQTSRIQQKIKGLIEQLPNIKMVRRFIDQMEKIWSTIQAFSHLSKTDSKIVQKLEAQLKAWRNEKQEILSLHVAELFNQFKNKILTEKQCIVDIKTKINKFSKEFESLYLKETSSRQFSVQEKKKIQSQAQKMETMFIIIEKQLKIIKISKYERFLKAQQRKSEGSYHIRHAITTVLNIERKQGRQLSQEEKLAYFKAAFNKALEQLKKIIYINLTQQRSYIRLIYDLYQNSMKLQSLNLRLFTYLPQLNIPLFSAQQNLQFSQFSKTLINYIIKQKVQNSNTVIQFKRQFSINASYRRTQRSNEELYFNMAEYFVKKDIPVYFQISKQILIEKCLNHKQIIREISLQMAQNQVILEIQMSIFQRINNILQTIGLALQQFEEFHNILHKEIKFERRNEDFAIKVKLAKHYQPMDEQHPNLEPKTVYIQELSKQLSIKSNQMLQEEPLSDLQRIIENNKDSEIFINIEYLKKLQAIINSSIDRQILQKHLQKTIIKLLKWSEIKRYIENTRQFSLIKQKLNKNLGQKICLDFKLLGLRFISINIYDYQLGQRRIEDMQFENSELIPQYNQGQSLSSKLQGLKYLDINKISQNLSKSIKPQNRLDTVRIGFKRKTKQFLNQQHNNFAQLLSFTQQGCNQQRNFSLNCEAIKQFIFKQLISKQSIHRLLQKISKLVEQGPDQLNNKSISQLFSKVNLQLQKFSLDIEQVSYKPTSLFIGYVHLTAVCLTWKKYMVQIQKSSQKPYEQLQKTQFKQRQYFLRQTSNDWKTRSQAQAQRVIQWIIKFYSTKIQLQKQKINLELSQQFKKKYERESVQQKIDSQIFSRNTKTQRLIHYLQKPSEVIRQYYKTQAAKFKQILQKKYRQRISYNNQIVKFKNIIEQLLKQFVKIGINQNVLNTSFLSIERTQSSFNHSSGIEVEEKLSQILLYILLDIITGIRNQSYYINELKVINKIPTLNFNVQVSQFLRDLVKQLKKQSFNVSNLYIFLTSLNKLLGDKTTTQILQKYLLCNQVDQAKFQSLSQVFICSQKCPGCGRPCGISTIHTTNHQTLFGHQVRGFNKVCYKNKYASVMRCQDIPQSSSALVKKGQEWVERTWKYLIKLFQSLQEGSWIFDDLMLNNKKDFFINAWREKGQQVCSKYNLKYMDYNSIQYQKAHLQDSIIHFLFVLDHSDSMSRDNRGKNLKESFSRTIIDLKQRQQPDITADEFKIKMKNPIRVTVLTFSNTCIVVQEDVPPSLVNIQLPQMSGGTKFSQALKKSYQIMSKYTKRKDIIKFIFMTDGRDIPLGNQLENIRELQNIPGNFIQYFGIQFMTSEKFMKDMQRQLKGKNKIQTDAQGLTDTFLQIIQVSID